MKYEHHGCTHPCSICQKAEALGWSQEELNKALASAGEFARRCYSDGKWSMWQWVALAIIEFVVILWLV